MLERRLTDTRSVRLAGGRYAELRYWILCDRIDGRNRYGLEISLRCGGVNERSAVYDITTSAARIRALAEQLARNTVAPCTLRDVVEDALERV